MSDDPALTVAHRKAIAKTLAGRDDRIPVLEEEVWACVARG